MENLTPKEFQDLLDAPVLVTLLVGAADGKFDREERTWSAKLVEARTYSKPEMLREYYKAVSEGFLQKADALAATLPSEPTARNAAISEKLAELNDVLAQLSSPLNYYLYKSLLGLAAETAKASGGFLRIGSVSAAEYAWVSLPMLNKIPSPGNLPVETEEDAEEDA